MAKTTNIGGVTRDMTAEEITELESWQTEAQVGIDALEAKEVTNQFHIIYPHVVK